VTLNALCERTQLRSINLNGITNFTGIVLKRLCCSLPELRNFELYFRGGGFVDVDIMTEGLINLNKLTSLTLRQMGMADCISEVIKANNKTLTKLDLSICQITDKTALEISSCSELLELQLQGCTQVTEETLNNIAKKCTKLVVVGFQGCRSVTNKTLQLLLPVSSQRQSLHTLLLDGCEQPTPVVLSSISKHTSLRILSLKFCPCVTVEEILGLSKCLQKLYILDISKCPRLPKKSTNLLGVGEDAYDQLYQELVISLPMTTIYY